MFFIWTVELMVVSVTGAENTEIRIHGKSIINSIQDIWAVDTIKTSNAKTDIDKCKYPCLQRTKT